MLKIISSGKAERAQLRAKAEMGRTRTLTWCSGPRSSKMRTGNTIKKEAMLKIISSGKAERTQLRAKVPMVGIREPKIIRPEDHEITSNTSTINHGHKQLDADKGDLERA